jgi:hypothetical protein
MNKVKKILFIFFLFSSAGLAYTLFVLNNIPESFDWNLKEEVDEDY